MGLEFNGTDITELQVNNNKYLLCFMNDMLVYSSNHILDYEYNYTQGLKPGDTVISNVTFLKQVELVVNMSTNGTENRTAFDVYINFGNCTYNGKNCSVKGIVSFYLEQDKEVTDELGYTVSAEFNVNGSDLQYSRITNITESGSFSGELKNLTITAKFSLQRDKLTYTIKSKTPNKDLAESSKSLELGIYGLERDNDSYCSIWPVKTGFSLLSDVKATIDTKVYYAK